MMYTIRERPPTYFTGLTNDDKQVLFGWLRDIVAVVIFDNAGILLEFREYPTNIDLRQGLGPAVEATVEQQVELTRKLLNIREGPIHVLPFEVASWNVGLQQFPLDLKDFLEHPRRFSQEDTQVFRNDIEAWKKASNCVLHWGNDYFLGRDGQTL